MMREAELRRRRRSGPGLRGVVRGQRPRGALAGGGGPITGQRLRWRAPVRARSGCKLTVIEPGEPMTRYHREAGQEDFLVLSGEAVLVIEDRSGRCGPGTSLHCPPGAGHAIIGAGSGPCVVLAIGSREHRDGPDAVIYPVTRSPPRTGPASSGRPAIRARRTPTCRSARRSAYRPAGCRTERD